IAVVGAHEADELALAGRSDRVADRALHETGAPGADPAGKIDLGLRPDRTHVDEQLAGDTAGEESRRSVINRLNRRGVRQNRDDGLDLSRKLAGRTGERGTGRFERLGLVRR